MLPVRVIGGPGKEVPPEKAFFGEPGRGHSDGGHVLFDHGRRGLARSVTSRCRRPP
jgi:hypothetical protein